MRFPSNSDKINFLLLGVLSNEDRSISFPIRSSKGNGVFGRENVRARVLPPDELDLGKNRRRDPWSYFTVSNTDDTIFFFCKSEFLHTFQELYRWRWLRTINIAWNVTMVYSVTLCKFLWKFLWVVVQFQPTPLMKHCKEFVIITINYVHHKLQPKLLCFHRQILLMPSHR